MEKKQFTFDFIEKQIRNKTFGILTTLNPDGTPHTTGILYGVSPPSANRFSLYFLTSTRYKKARNIRKNPNVSLIIPFPHYYIRFAPSLTVTFNGKAEITSLENRDVHDIFSKKRILRLVIKQSEEDTESLTFIRIKPDPKVLVYGLGYNILKLRKGHRHGGYSVMIPQERLV